MLGASTYHQHVPYDTGPRVQLLGVLSPQRLQVHAHAREKVFRLPDVHPEACGDRANGDSLLCKGGSAGKTTPRATRTMRRALPCSSMA